MNILGPTPVRRLNEATGLLCLGGIIFLTISIVSYHPRDPSWNTAPASPQAINLMGPAGAHVADICLQAFGLGAFLLPVYLLLVAWQWVRSTPIPAQWAKLGGALLLLLSTCAIFSLGVEWTLFSSGLKAGGVVGMVLGEWLLASLNLGGAVLATSSTMLISLYLISSFSVAYLPGWFGAPARHFAVVRDLWLEWRASRAMAKQRRIVERVRPRRKVDADQGPPWEVETPAMAHSGASSQEEIPIRTLEDAAPAAPPPRRVDPAVIEYVPPPQEAPTEKAEAVRLRPPAEYELPPTGLLNEPEGRGAYDAQELKEIAARVKSKFEEFNVLGSVVQINPGPVVTTFEFKPEAGIKYSRITTLSEDLCLGLQAESILIERIPGKPTVGIEVPNTRREVISLRQLIESGEFTGSPARMTIALGKDISGRIKIAALEAMPHLLIAGSTGSGKSVMLNSLIMSVLYKSTPEEVRMILVDPKRVEMGIYEGIPHLLTPVITDTRKATNALRNAVLEMERRLKLLASFGVRNIDQFNRKIQDLMLEPRSLFEEDEPPPEELSPLPYILIVIDELSDLMMVERSNVEESITRLAQMARAVGMHLVVATQRPSVDVITGLIKANFPARLSFRVATRVDSRTILDQMGAEHLLGKGDMLFMPPGSGRMMRYHGAFVTETEINRVVDFWKKQARPEYDQSFLIAPPDSEESEDGGDLADGRDDPAYVDAVRVVCEIGKASTSTLQRRLRLGYGRAARMLDMMQREGIIGPPDGSRPRDVLRRPEWLDEVESPAR